jgi:hypothetical protein
MGCPCAACSIAPLKVISCQRICPPTTTRCSALAAGVQTYARAVLTSIRRRADGQLGESTGSGSFLERDRLDAKAREIKDVLRRAPRTRLPLRCKTVAEMRRAAIDMHGAGIVGGFFTPRRSLDYEFATHSFKELAPTIY